MKRSILAVILSTLLLAGFSAHAGGIWTSVDAQQSVFFAGHTQLQLNNIVTADPTYNTGHYYGDLSDPDTLPDAVDITGLGPLISIRASGSWTHGPCCLPTGPEGKADPRLALAQYGIFGISLLTADLNMLVGVFLDNSLPSLGVAPAALSTTAGDDMTMPLLSQAFAIGAGLNNITVPVGATRLFLGMHDAFEWTNNSGTVRVHVETVPEPATLLITGLGLLGLGLSRRRT